jgi:hypothetical protein
MGCFTDQVKLTHTLVWDLDEAVKEVKLHGEHEEESSQKIIELEALCKKLREDTQRLEEEKGTLEGMVKSHDELLIEIARKIGLDQMGEDEEDADDGGDVAAPPATVPPPPVPPAAAPEEIDEEGPVEAIPSKKSQCRMRSSWQMLSPRFHDPVFTMHSWGTMRRIRPGWRMTLMIWMMTRMKAALTLTSGLPTMEVMIGIDSLNLCLKFRIKNKFFGSA